MIFCLATIDNLKVLCSTFHSLDHPECTPDFEFLPTENRGSLDRINMRPQRVSVLVTTLIVARILWVGRRVNHALSLDSLKIYIRVTSILIESALPFILGIVIYVGNDKPPQVALGTIWGPFFSCQSGCGSLVKNRGLTSLSHRKYYLSSSRF